MRESCRQPRSTTTSDPRRSPKTAPDLRKRGLWGRFHWLATAGIPQGFRRRIAPRAVRADSAYRGNPSWGLSRTPGGRSIGGVASTSNRPLSVSSRRETAVRVRWNALAEAVRCRDPGPSPILATWIGRSSSPWWYVLSLERRRRRYYSADATVRVSAAMTPSDKTARADWTARRRVVSPDAPRVRRRRRARR
jgi:hypothetical protein